jgi:hypothetical protein
MSRRRYVRFLIALGILLAAAVALHLLSGGALRSLGETIHGRP